MHREVGLAPEPASVRRARHAVEDTLRRAGQAEDVVDTAALLVSELVTNAVVHARSSVGITVTVNRRGVVVEVADHSPHLPVQRSFTTDATTGRGLELLQALSVQHGARRTDSGGKVVWFALGQPQPERAEQAAPQPEPSVEVRLLHLPVGLYATFLEHAASLLREHLMTALDEATRADASEADDAAAGNEALTVLAEAVAPSLAAAAPGASSVDARAQLPRSAVPRFLTLQRALDRAVAQAAAGLLLAPASQPEIRRLRIWCCDQVVNQAMGADPEPWSRLDASAAPMARESPAWDTSSVTASDRALLAADDANRILAVSAPAAELLGWSREALVGRRLVAIIPPRMHEAHIAGFVRFLLTGERHVVGRRVEMPALRQDGSEVQVGLLVEAHRLPSQRTVLVAELDPA
ncbi:ATP-binding protein [Motilibacter peucedani]|uniref:ATP-binding protein n=1 Tax=Motilibacter peucedani TaxID=598650 RepID=UPI0016049BA2|nr:ATP-binding protein [Motilibacter peucedani]